MEAVGFASSILTFLDISYKIIRGAYEVHNTVSGATSENTYVGNVVQDLEKAANRLIAGPQKTNDLELIRISKSCYDLSQDLGRLLEKLRAKDGSLRESFKASWATMRKQSEVKQMEERLDRYRSEIALRLNLLMCDSDSEVKQQLLQLRQTSDMVNNHNTQALDNIQMQLDTIVQKLQFQSREASATTETITDSPSCSTPQANEELSGGDKVHERADMERETHEMGIADDYHHLAEKLDALRELMSSMPRENHVLRKLCFDSILRREEAIQDPVADTYSWILEEPPISETSMTSRLETSRQENPRRETASKLMSFLRGDGQIFFISGKAGCGKSTLMKYLGHASMVQKALTTWAGECKLVVVGMYFWSSNDPLQKSLRGFYRSLLYHTLKQCPEFIGTVFPGSNYGGLSPPDTVGFSISELEAAFTRLVNLRASESHRFCYFIDGLDEYEGDNLEHQSLAKRLVSWADGQAVKIVCSARPHTVFLEVFENFSTTVHFHASTQSDIRRFAESKFSSELGEPRYQEARETCLGMVSDIVHRAEGVFLWASLVVRSLINGSLEYEDNEGLRQRLDDCPDDLNGMYRKMLEKVDSSSWSRKRSRVILYLTTHNPSIRLLNAITLSWLKDCDWFQAEGSKLSFPLDRERIPLSEKEITERHQHVKKLLHRSTRGLLVMVHDGSRPLYARYSVDFFHRSARDFLKEELASPPMPISVPSAVWEIEAYSTLLLAEMKFAPVALYTIEPTTKTLLPSAVGLWIEYYLRCLGNLGMANDCTIPFSHLEEVSKIARSGLLFSPSFEMLVDDDSALSGMIEARPLRSFVHFAAFHRQGPYVRRCIMDGTVAKDTVEMNLLLNSSISGDYGTARLLLSRGWQHSEKIEIIYFHSGRRLVSVWMVFLRHFAQYACELAMYPGLREYCRPRANLIELYLQAGADHTVYFVLKKQDNEGGFFRADLYQIMEALRLPNLSTLHKLLRKGTSLKDRLRNYWAARPHDLSPHEQLPWATTEILLRNDFRVHGVFSMHGEGLEGPFTFNVF